MAINSIITKIVSFFFGGKNVPSGGTLTDQEREVLEQLIMRWKGSPEREMQLKGEMYYLHEHDILLRKRQMIGENGKLQTVDNLPNNHIIDNQYAKLVDQKMNYLLGQPFVVSTKNKAYSRLLQEVFNKGFLRLLKRLGKHSLNHGVAWLYPHYSQEGDLAFRCFPGYEIMPLWEDSDRAVLSAAVRLYTVQTLKDGRVQAIEKAEVYKANGVTRFILEGNKLIPDLTEGEATTAKPYVDYGSNAMGWQKIPLIPFKYNDAEIPLIKRVKSLQDGINAILSDFTNNMQEDARNTILVIKNYDGQDLGEFRRNLATFGAVKVLYDGEVKGGVETLEINVNSENYKTILAIFQKALIANGMGFDAKDDRMANNPNQMNIQTMYADIDLDANGMETEYQAAFQELLWFVNNHLANSGKGDFAAEEVEIVFNRDLMTNEKEIIENIRASAGLISDETLVAQHPWVDDVEAELERLRKQKEEELMQQYEVFGDPGTGEGVDET